MDRGHKCEYKKQVPEKVIDQAIAEIIIKLVRNPRFAALMQDKINMKVDTTALEQEIATHEKQLRQYHATKSKLIEEIDSLDPDDRHYIQRKADLDERLYRMYDRIEEAETLLIDARARKRAIEADKVRGDNIYRILTHFDKLYDVMSDSERQELMQALISEIQIYEAPLPSGQWIKSIRFRLPIIDGDTELCLDNSDGVECVTLMTKSN
jgi:site-specific DNA recombinase